jgi:hypothetical protein
VPVAGALPGRHLPGTDTQRFADVARGYAIAMAPGILFSPDQRYRDHLGLSFALMHELLDRAMAGLAAAWHNRGAGCLDLTM